MKFRSSIFYTITFIFALATIGVSLALIWLIGYDKQNYTRELNTKYSIVARSHLYQMSRLISQNEFQRQIANFEFSNITDENFIKQLNENGEILDSISADIGSADIIMYNRKNYLKITHANEVRILNDKEYQPYRYDIFRAIYGGILVIILLAYIFIIRKIKPLRKLKRQIDKFATGDLNIANVATGTDEISEVSRAFYGAVTQINKLNESRHLFLRNIMHELKTPITKGRITVEMIEKNKYQERLLSVFERLEDLINEFAAVERATSGIPLGERGIYSAKEIINEALKIAMIGENLVTINAPEDLKFNVDLKLFSIAVKNLIDNAIKYSTDRHVIINVAETFDFISNSPELEQDFEHYKEAFSKGSNAKQSFGLGLYIVDNIAKSHGLAFKYRRENETNVFYFDNMSEILL
ncbi:ArsS family sensor histidine kinase [Campylobacter sp. JMF_02 ED1]|uniref:ArsS family sensor histidine kinase n=1 Tax=unclassified Campylobacter TaxID=2593542 RepID=UPI0022E9AC05|nr:MULTISPECIES: ArsS family sensor histidine kinase [unclassified Campylobacter]MDA3049365.1 ArsS family sensor histidine kinase [Campylobacter sp. JMF_15 NE4]MDA3051207.1 ArsS family sensor histidine kinase [Campylobacter sp. JMF_02 ED1]